MTNADLLLLRWRPAPLPASPTPRGDRAFYARTTVHPTADFAARATDRSPSPARARSGHYRKGTFRWHGLTLAIENPRGSTRSGTDQSGKPWSVLMKSHYGYIVKGRRAHDGADGDPVDVFVGPYRDARFVYVVDQVDPATGRFDEHKCLVDYPTAEHARRAYLENYEPGWKGLGSLTPVPVAAFVRWVAGTDRRPVANGRRAPRGSPLTRFAHYAAAARAQGPGVQHAPTGGATVQGTFFAGGEFIPAGVMAKASSAEKRAVARGKDPAAGASASATTTTATAGPRIARRTAPLPAKPKKERAAIKGDLVEARRVGRGKDSRIVLADGSPAPPHVLAAMIPPAATHVRISLDPDSDVIAKYRTGVKVHLFRSGVSDDPLLDVYGQQKRTGGLVKTVYRNTFEMMKDAEKWSRIDEMLRKEHDLHAEIQRGRTDPDPATREAADCAWLIEEQATRPSSEADLGKNTSYGATTLRAEHVVDHEDGVHLQFVGKEGVLHDHRIEDRRLADMLLERKRTAAARDGKIFATNETKLNKFIGGLDGGLFTAKDFRTLKATKMAIAIIGAMGDCCPSEKAYRKKVGEVGAIVARKLGNKAKQAVVSYISPFVWSGWSQGPDADADADAGEETGEDAMPQPQPKPTKGATRA